MSTEPPAFALRRGRPDDAGSITTVHLRSKRSAMPWLAEPHSDEEAERWVREGLDRFEVWVAEVHGDVVAYVAFEPGNLDQLYVVPGHQGEGIGSALVQLAKDRAGPPLRLWAFQRNRAARGFYERRGFRAVTLTDGENNDEREPDVSYEWTG